MELRNVWLIYKSKNQNAVNTAISFSKELTDIGIGVKIIKGGSSLTEFPSLNQSDLNDPDLAIVMGGDGTVLSAARHLAPHKIPILSFNVGGNLGFLTHDKSLLKVKDIWKMIKNDHFEIKKRMMLQAKVEIESGEKESSNSKTFLALNDFYLRPNIDEKSPTCSLQLEIDEEAVDIYKGDGLILSSPTGSTAYSMAAGGPILHPEIEAIIVTAICPMSLSSRPIVVPSNSMISIKSTGDSSHSVKLWQDGIRSTELTPRDNCLIQKSPHYAQILILDPTPSYYTTLTRKLHWAGSVIDKKKS